MTDQQSPAGWHPVSASELRYWDGHQWTEHTSTNYQGPPDWQRTATAKPWYRTVPAILAFAAIAFVGFVAVAVPTEETPPESADQSASAEPIAEAPAEPVETAEPAVVEEEEPRARAAVPDRSQRR